MRQSRKEISSQALLSNLNNIKSKSGSADVICTVKADAYGHGALEVVTTLRKANVEWLAVAYCEEALELRNAGDSGKIMVIVPPIEPQAELIVKYELSFVCDRIELAEHVSKYAVDNNKNIGVHIFINTGMNRDGIRPEEVSQFADKIKDLPNVFVEGVLTQLAASEYKANQFTISQIDKFKYALDLLSYQGVYPPMVHCLNSGGILNYPNAQFTHVRAGLALYGAMDFQYLANEFGLRAVMSLKSNILSIRDAFEGEFVGYSFMYPVFENKKIAIVPIGYGDGYMRVLSNKADVLVSGKRCRVIGSICMDQLMIDISQIDCKQGDEVVLIGKQGKEEITANELAELCGTIPYEIFTNLSRKRLSSILF